MYGCTYYENLLMRSPVPRLIWGSKMWAGPAPSLQRSVFMCRYVYHVFRCRKGSFRIASTFYEKIDKRFVLEEGLQIRISLHVIYETRVLRGLKTMLRIEKVLRTRSAISVSSSLMCLLYLGQLATLY